MLNDRFFKPRHIYLNPINDRIKVLNAESALL